MKSLNRMSTNELYKFYIEWVDKSRFPKFKDLIIYLVNDYTIPKRHPAAVRYTITKCRSW